MGLSLASEKGERQRREELGIMRMNGMTLLRSASDEESFGLSLHDRA